jgi:valyl-tRNA synthetase
MLKKIICALLFVISLASFSACSEEAKEAAADDSREKTTTTEAVTTTTAATTKRNFVAYDTSDETFYSIETYGDYVKVLERLKKEYIAEAIEINRLSNALTNSDFDHDAVTYNIDREISRMDDYYDLEEDLGDEYETYVTYLFSLRADCITSLQNQQYANEVVEDGMDMLFDALF